MQKLEPTCPKESLENTIAFDSKDWGADKRSAWIYGIILGWNDNELGNEIQKDIRQEFKRKFDWKHEDFERLEMLHDKFEKAFL